MCEKLSVRRNQNIYLTQENPMIISKALSDLIFERFISFNEFTLEDTLAVIKLR